MVCLGFEPGAAGSQVQTKPWSYGGHQIIKNLLNTSFSIKFYFLKIFCFLNLAIPGLFLVYYRPFLIPIAITISIQIEKSVNIRTQGRRMVGADETTELWRPPHNFFLSHLNTNTRSTSNFLSLSLIFAPFHKV